MAIKVPPILEMDEFDDSINIGMVAPSGVGKSVWSGSAPNAVFLQTDPGGTISSKRFGSKAQVIKCNKWEDFDEAVIWLRDGKGYKRYKWVIVDGGSMGQELLTDFLGRRAVAGDVSRNRFIPAPGDYFENQNTIKYTFKQLIDLPVNTIINFWPMLGENETGDEIILPQIHGQKGATAHAVLGLFSAYAYMRVVKRKDGKVVRRIHWEQVPEKPWLAKNRYHGALGKFTDDIDVPGIEKLIMESGTTPTRRPSGARPATRRTK